MFEVCNTMDYRHFLLPNFAISSDQLYDTQGIKHKLTFDERSEVYKVEGWELELGFGAGVSRFRIYPKALKVSIISSDSPESESV